MAKKSEYENEIKNISRRVQRLKSLMLSICKNYNQFVLLLQMCKSEDLNHTACSCQKEIIINTEIPKSWNVFPTLTTVNHPRSGGKEAAGTSGIFIFSKSRSQIAFLPLYTLCLIFFFYFFFFIFKCSGLAQAVGDQICCL